MASGSSSGLYKRARAHNNSLLSPSCLVDGCLADLSNCRDYHKRHKVCEAHSKTPRVTIGGQERRFCQQCSRFHSLGEFDESKRSCRKRLDGHNRRRRKPQSDSLSMNSSKYIPIHQGSKLISYGAQYFPTSALETSPWNDAIICQSNRLYSPDSQLNLKTISFSSSFPQVYRGEKQFPFLHGVTDSSGHFSGGSGSNSSPKMLFSDGFDLVIKSGSASSLLSSSHADPCRLIPTHTPVPNTTSHYSGLGRPAMDSVLVAENSSRSKTNTDSLEMIQNCPDGFQQTISFPWG